MWGGGRSPAWRPAAAAAASVWVVLTMWALIIPPYQVGDEVQHALRATSVTIQPWISGGDHFMVDPRYTNPIARNPGPQLGRLFFRGENALSREDIAILRQRQWDPRRTSEPPVREQWAGASYPTLYQATIFAVAEPLTQLLRLTPYQSTYAYRLVSVGFASLLWGLVFDALRRRLGAADARRVLLLLVAIPTLAFTSAGVNPDAVVFPLATLALLAAWRLLVDGRGAWLPFALLTSVALIKPSGLVLAVAIGVGAVGTGLAGGARWRQAGLTVVVALAVLLASWLVFYAWSPPRFLGGGPVDEGTVDWLVTVVRRAPVFFKMFWGWLGWLDYTLPPLWYKWLAVLLLVNGILALRRLRRAPGDLFPPLAFAAFIALVTVGELVWLSQAGYNIQGRHFLPAALGLSPLVRHDRRLAHAALLAFLVVMHAAFVRQTVLRYYGGELGTLLAALPWGR